MPFSIAPPSPASSQYPHEMAPNFAPKSWTHWSGPQIEHPFAGISGHTRVPAGFVVGGVDSGVNTGIGRSVGFCVGSSIGCWIVGWIVGWGVGGEVGWEVGWEVGSSVGTPVGIGIKSCGPHPHKSLIIPGSNTHSSTGIKPCLPASWRFAHDTEGCPGNENTASGLLISKLSPHTEQDWGSGGDSGVFTAHPHTLTISIGRKSQ